MRIEKIKFPDHKFFKKRGFNFDRNNKQDIHKMCGVVNEQRIWLSYGHSPTTLIKPFGYNFHTDWGYDSIVLNQQLNALSVDYKTYHDTPWASNFQNNFNVPTTCGQIVFVSVHSLSSEYITFKDLGYLDVLSIHESKITSKKGFCSYLNQTRFESLLKPIEKLKTERAYNQRDWNKLLFYLMDEYEKTDKIDEKSKFIKLAHKLWVHRSAYHPRFEKEYYDDEMAFILENSEESERYWEYMPIHKLE